MDQLLITTQYALLGLLLWMVLGTLVIAVWMLFVWWAGRQRTRRWVSAWNKWLGYDQ